MGSFSKKRPPRVVIFAGKGPSAVTLQRLQLSAQALLKAGYQLDIVSARNVGLEPVSGLNEHLIRIPFPGLGLLWNKIWYLPCSILMLFRVLFLNPCRFIIVFSPGHCLLAKPAAFFSATPIFWFLKLSPWTGNEERWMLTRGILAMKTFFARLSAHVIVVTTRTLYNELKSKWNLCLDKIKVTPYPVSYPVQLLGPESEKSLNLEKYIAKPSAAQWKLWRETFKERREALCERFDLPERSTVMLAICPLEQSSNLSTLIRGIAASELARLYLIICGEGPEKASIISIINGLGLGDQVIVSSWFQDYADLTAGCDVFVVPSLREGMSASLLSALGTGTLVVGANTREMKEILVYDELLFDPSDVENIAIYLKTISNDKAWYENAQELCESRSKELNFDWVSRILSFE